MSVVRHFDRQNALDALNAAANNMKEDTMAELASALVLFQDAMDLLTTQERSSQSSILLLAVGLKLMYKSLDTGIDFVLQGVTEDWAVGYRQFLSH